MVKAPLNIFSIQGDDIELLKKFLSSAGSSLESFRYFESRPLSVLKNHVVTCILIENDEPVGYGHLDKDGDRVWLGVAVSVNFKGRGFGPMIMDFLLKKAKEKNIKLLHLAVDKDNKHAVNLYKKFGFVYIWNINERSILMELNI